MILRLASGSETPASLPMKSSVASTWITVTPRFSAKVFMTCFASSSRSRPWSTKTQVSWSPIARWISAAATEESTPPDRPRITCSAPTCSRMRMTDSSTKFGIVQSGFAPHSSSTKRRNIAGPCLVWVTSGWNWTA